MSLIESSNEKSFGLTKQNVNDDEIFNIVNEIFTEAKKYKLMTIMGGNISVKSKDFVKKLYDKKLLDKIETRNIIFKLNKNNVDNLDNVEKEVFEKLSKDSFDKFSLNRKLIDFNMISNFP